VNLHFKYWLFQCIGWGLFAWLNIYIGFVTNQNSMLDIYINFILSAVGMFITHSYRNYIKAQNLQHFSTSSILKYVTAAVPILSFIYIIFYLLLIFILKNQFFKDLNVSSIAGSFLSAMVIFVIWNAIYFFWRYIEHNRTVLIEKLDIQTQKKDLEIKTIKANLQPHFIFNSLNSIRALIHENPELARTSITQLSNILRNSITNEATLVSLQKEMDVVNDYLSLEKVRFEERLLITKHIEPATLELQIPSMMIQTLVENAVKHGISKLEKGGEISIISFVELKTLHIQITNTGTLAKTNDTQGLGFGLSSSKQRLALIYNNKASLTLTEKNNEVTAHISIPL
jgi:sensor histidine kinase YesM